MGVPAFFRWLAEKYPKIVEDLLEKRQSVVDGVAIPLNLLEANPNAVEYDNLYVDMNGLIHPCSHPEDREAPSTEFEMYVNVTKYVDRLFAAIRPRRLLFLAIDGVAPRAKMNQQRSRRFRAAKDAKDKEAAMEEVLEEMRAMGLDPPPKDTHAWDSNVITPGTEFMARLSTYLRFYVLDRMNSDPAWRNIKVILSDASVPGEGEHKIMTFIRNQRNQPGYDPNQRHVLHGLDADLIMLSLATHEAHFTILREEVTFGRKQDQQAKSDAQKMLDDQTNREGAAISSLFPEDEWVYGKRLQRLNIAVLREYLAVEFSVLKAEGVMPFPFDFERIIDDFVFLCFFVGNDFLPHLPSLDIRDGAIEFLIEMYKDLLPSMGEYITSPGGNVNLRQVDIILGRVGQVEDEVFQRRKAMEDAEAQKKARQSQRNKHGMSRDKYEGEQLLKSIQNKTFSSTATFAGADIDRVTLIPLGVPAISASSVGEIHSSQSNSAAAQQLRNKMLSTKASSVSSQFTPHAAMEVTEGATSTGKRSFNDTESGVVAIGQKSARLSVDGDYSVIETFSETASIHNNSNIFTDDISVAMIEANDNDNVEEDLDIGDSLVTPTVADESVIAAAVTHRLGGHQKALSSSQSTREFKDIVKNRLKLKEQHLIEKNKVTIVDNIKLHEKGWKDRYYCDPFKKTDIEKNGGLNQMCYHYIKGLCWVFKYYYDGCASWNWFYPFHYAPFASDLVNVDSYDIQFDLSTPFYPFEQLLSVLPSESSHALPEACSWLMSDADSPILDIYNSDIPIDPNGKALPHLWVLLIPFIDESRVQAAMASCTPNLSDEEKHRNSRGNPLLFLHKNNDIATVFLNGSNYAPIENPNSLPPITISSSIIDSSGFPGLVYFDCTAGKGICGNLVAPPSLWFSPIDSLIEAPTRPRGAFRDVTHNNVLCLTYLTPPTHEHRSILLDDVCLDEPKLSGADLMPRRPIRMGRGKINIVDISQHTRTGSSNNNGTSFQATTNYSQHHPGQMRYEEGLSASMRHVAGALQYSGGRSDTTRYDSTQNFGRPRPEAYNSGRYNGSSYGRDGYRGDRDRGYTAYDYRGYQAEGRGASEFRSSGYANEGYESPRYGYNGRFDERQPQFGVGRPDHRPNYMVTGGAYNNSGYDQPTRSESYGRGGIEYQRADSKPREYIPAAKYPPHDGASSRSIPPGAPHGYDRALPYRAPPEKPPAFVSGQRYEVNNGKDPLQYSGDRNQQVRMERPPAKFVHSAGPSQNSRSNIQGGPGYRPPPVASVATPSSLTSGRGPPPPSRDPRLRK